MTSPTSCWNLEVVLISLDRRRFVVLHLCQLCLYTTRWCNHRVPNLKMRKIQGGRVVPLKGDRINQSGRNLAYYFLHCRSASVWKIGYHPEFHIAWSAGQYFVFHCSSAEYQLIEDLTAGQLSRGISLFEPSRCEKKKHLMCFQVFTYYSYLFIFTKA